MRRFLAAGVAAGVLALAAGGCGGASGGSGGFGSSSTPCLVLVSGNKVCGQDAAAWCRATDNIRQGTTDPTLQQTQQDCNSLETQYP